MRYSFYIHLKNKVTEDPNCSLLLAQWEFDRRLIERALNAISNNFPHYSLHDSSHSNTILTQIEKILGEDRIKLLSPTDTWLLLESAYLHDIGMVLSDEQTKDILKSKEFKDYLVNISNNSRHELNEAAKLFLSKPENLGGLKLDGEIWPLEIKKNLILILAEYHRSKHALHSEEIINSPYEKIGLDSPRNGLIPNRLFNIIGKICSAHGKSFQDVMTLNYREDGVSTDYAQPRYIACLLRLGDLLDVDSDRFNEVLLSNFGKLPYSSELHYNKHLSIKHIRIDQERIELTAECKDLDTYTITLGWFNMIREEIGNQMSNWSLIVPSIEFGLLPLVDNMDVNLIGYKLLPKGIPPKFDVDRKRTIEILRGTNIYKDSFIFIRELLQNAIDASLIKIWLDKKNISDHFSYDEFRNISNNYPIEITINQVTNDPISSVWKIIIKDYGIGISLNDIHYIQNITGARDNSEKTKIIYDMPEWLKPSGTFGIGLQSIFMVANSVKIRTKSYKPEQPLEITLFSPIGKDLGNILIKEMGMEYYSFIGTELELIIDFDKFPDISSTRIDDNFVVSYLDSYDPINEQSFELSINKIISRIHQFALISYLPIKINENLIVRKEFDRLIFDEKENISMSIEPSFDFERISLFYRNQEVDDFHYAINCFNLKCNLLFANSDEILTINREKTIIEKRDFIYEKILKSFNNVLPLYIQQMECLSKDEKEEKLAIISLYLELYADKSIISNIPKDILPLWKKIVINNESKISLSDLLNFNKITVYNKRGMDRPFRKRTDIIKINKINNEEIEIDFIGSGFQGNLINAIINILLNNYHCKVEKFNITDSSKEITSQFVFNKNECVDYVSSEALLSLIKYRGFFEVNRKLIPCPNKKYMPLVINLDLVRGKFDKLLIEYFKYHIINPFIYHKGNLTIGNINNLIKYTKKHVVDDNQTEETIAKLYLQFIREIDDLMKDVTEWNKFKQYDISDIEREIMKYYSIG